MTRTKRLCPACGAANSLEMEKCYVCGASFNLPVPLEQRLPVPWKGVGASLALGTTALALSAGLRLAKHFLEQGAVKPVKVHGLTSLPSKARKWLLRRGETEDVRRERPQVRVWGRRMWGKWMSDGTRHVEVEEIDWQVSGR